MPPQAGNAAENAAEHEDSGETETSARLNVVRYSCHGGPPHRIVYPGARPRAGCFIRQRLRTDLFTNPFQHILRKDRLGYCGLSTTNGHKVAYDWQFSFEGV